MTQLIINSELRLTPFLEKDIPLLIQYLNDKEIYNNTFLVPYPYTKEDATWWINHTEEEQNRLGTNYNWAIRDKENSVIGGISVNNPEHSETSCEIGYWLALPFRNKGIMTKVVDKFTSYLLVTLKYKEIVASVFFNNIGSDKVLEKCGFELSEIKKEHRKKDSVLIDCKIYKLID